MPAEADSGNLGGFPVLVQACTTGHRLVKSVTIWWTLVQCGKIGPCLVLLDTVWHGVVLFGTVCHSLAPSGGVGRPPQTALCCFNGIRPALITAALSFVRGISIPEGTGDKVGLSPASTYSYTGEVKSALQQAPERWI